MAPAPTFGPFAGDLLVANGDPCQRSTLRIRRAPSRGRSFEPPDGPPLKPSLAGCRGKQFRVLRLGRRLIANGIGAAANVVIDFAEGAPDRFAMRVQRMLQYDDLFRDNRFWFDGHLTRLYRCRDGGSAGERSLPSELRFRLFARTPRQLYGRMLFTRI